MATLNHVYLLSKNGMRHVTAEEMAAIHPGGTISARSGLLICDLCGQYVTLTDGDKVSRYFRHSSFEESKDCPERSRNNYYSPEFSNGEHNLPVRIKILNEYNFMLELGFIYIPKDILEQCENQKVLITPSNSFCTSYGFLLERFNQEGITYLPIGNIPSRFYSIKVDEKISSIWPGQVDGISEDTVFKMSKSSTDNIIIGRKIDKNSEVVVGENYLIITKQSYTQINQELDINKICEQKNEHGTWKIYKLCANEYTEYAIDFFLKRKYRLTQKPISMQIVWPAYRQMPYTIQHDRDNTYIHVEAKNNSIEDKVSHVNVYTFPEASSKTFFCAKSINKVVELKCNDRQQLISVGRSKLAQYTYFWRENHNELGITPEVKVRDLKENNIESKSYSILPSNRTIVITTQFDGKIVIKNNNTITDIINCKALKNEQINDIYFDQRIEVYQGNDLIWYVEYKKNANKFNDDIIYNQLKGFNDNKIKVSHNIGVIAYRLNQCKKTKAWLRKQIRSGYVSQNAIDYIKELLGEKNEKI